MEKTFKIKEQTKIKQILNLEISLLIKDKNKIVGEISKKFDKDYYCVGVGRIGTERATLKACFDFIAMMNQPIFGALEIEFKY